MPYAIVIHVDKTGAARLASLWHVLAERDDLGRVKFSDEQIRFNYPPHIILTVVDTGMIKPHASASSIQRVRARSGEQATISIVQNCVQSTRKAYDRHLRDATHIPA
jgi:hypothetical protein